MTNFTLEVQICKNGKFSPCTLENDIKGPWKFKMENNYIYGPWFITYGKISPCNIFGNLPIQTPKLSMNYIFGPCEFLLKTKRTLLIS